MKATILGVVTEIYEGKKTYVTIEEGNSKIKLSFVDKPKIELLERYEIQAVIQGSEFGGRQNLIVVQSAIKAV
ncbi:MAG: hypothetical protein Q8M66_07570 [Actinomycetota bacterium]|nr:hypothetical protein [Actinomycetota bacterium]MDZ4221196.1 hypothetical protein [Methylobacter sp.]